MFASSCNVQSDGSEESWTTWCLFDGPFSCLWYASVYVWLFLSAQPPPPPPLIAVQSLIVSRLSITLLGGRSSLSAPWWSGTPSTGRWRPSTAVSASALRFRFLFPHWSLSSSLLCRSEYQLAKPSDSHRKEMLFGSLAKAGHPMGKFCWGELANTTTGTHNPRGASSGFRSARTNRSAETAARAPSHAEAPARSNRPSAAL